MKLKQKHCTTPAICSCAGVNVTHLLISIIVIDKNRYLHTKINHQRESRLWVVTLVLYTCILIPLMQLKRTLASMFGLMIFDTKSMTKEMEFPEFASLAVARYEDLGGEDGEREEICSICLVEYEEEDAT
ncbi:hypothetical protein CR513_30163, partial [Mucuna pruriens]